MHEFSLAMNLLELCAEERRRRPDAARVRRVIVRAGAFSGVHAASLVFAFDALRADYGMAEAELVVESTPGVRSCPDCGARTTVGEELDLSCPACGGTNGELVEGREFILAALEVE